MRMSRHTGMYGTKIFPIPSFNGSYALFGDNKKGYIEMYSSGTLTYGSGCVVDMFAVNGGYVGGSSAHGQAAAGGKSGCTDTALKVAVPSGNITVTVGAGGRSGGISSCGSYLSVEQGANGGSAGGYASYNSSSAAGSGKSDGAGGQETTTRAFGEADGVLYAGGGGGGGNYNIGGAGGDGGGGAGGNGKTSSSTNVNGKSGTANTGGGGGGGGVYPYSPSAYGSGGSGGSGIVIVRWGY